MFNSNDDPMDAKDFMVVVWPDSEIDVEIPENSTLHELSDTFDFATTIELLAEDEVTFRLRENATDTMAGYIWESLPEEIQLSCVDLEDANYGNFNTGY
jgi:hypothetical protein